MATTKYQQSSDIANKGQAAINWEKPEHMPTVLSWLTQPLNLVAKQLV